MNIFQLFKNIGPFVKPYRLLVIITLILTLVGSIMQQVNAIVLDLNSVAWFHGYHFSYEILPLNALLTMAGLWLLKR